MNHSSYLPSLRGPRSALRAGFTLVEMLIVAAIILVLAGLLLPVLHAARNAGAARACSSNMHQLGLAFQQYTQDFNSSYPGPGCYFPQFAGLKDWSAGGNWVAGASGESLAAAAAPYDPIPGAHADVEDGALYTYTKNSQVYICPANKDGEAKHLSYSMNCALTGINGVRIRYPSDIVLLVDEEKANDGYFYAVNDGPYLGNTTLATNPSGSWLGVPPVIGNAGNSTDALTQLHNSGGNLLFCDGHVKFYPFAEFPLDDTPTGKENKWKQIGSPRFHDPAFGQYGSAPSYHLAPNVPDFCNATQRLPNT